SLRYEKTVLACRSINESFELSTQVRGGWLAGADGLRSSDVDHHRAVHGHHQSFAERIDRLGFVSTAVHCGGTDTTTSWAFRSGAGRRRWGSGTAPHA